MIQRNKLQSHPQVHGTCCAQLASTAWTAKKTMESVPQPFPPVKSGRNSHQRRRSFRTLGACEKKGVTPGWRCPVEAPKVQLDSSRFAINPVGAGVPNRQTHQLSCLAVRDMALNGVGPHRLCSFHARFLSHVHPVFVGMDSIIHYKSLRAS